jgi:hypothetical protein
MVVADQGGPPPFLSSNTCEKRKHDVKLREDRQSDGPRTQAMAVLHPSWPSARPALPALVTSSVTPVPAPCAGFCSSTVASLLPPWHSRTPTRHAGLPAEHQLATLHPTHHAAVMRNTNSPRVVHFCGIQRPQGPILTCTAPNS